MGDRHKNHRARTEDFAYEVSTRVGAMRWNAAHGGVLMPKSVRRHPEEHHGPTLLQVEGQLRELRWLDERHSVPGQ